MEKKENIKLICKPIWYYSKMDEELFFDWIQKIKSIDSIQAVGDELLLCFKGTDISDDDLRELLAVFYRYKIDMKQLQIFLNDHNKEWLYGKPKGYWHRRVFGVSK